MHQSVVIDALRVGDVIASALFAEPTLVQHVQPLGRAGIVQQHLRSSGAFGRYKERECCHRKGYHHSRHHDKDSELARTHATGAQDHHLAFSVEPPQAEQNSNEQTQRQDHFKEPRELE